MHEEHSNHPPIQYGGYIFIWLALIGLTGLTVAAAGVDVGILNVGIALLIATVKVTLVLMFFMHLKYEPLAFKLMFLITISLLAIFIMLTYMDTLSRVVIP